LSNMRSIEYYILQGLKPNDTPDHGLKNRGLRRAKALSSHSNVCFFYPLSLWQCCHLSQLQADMLLILFLSKRIGNGSPTCSALGVGSIEQAFLVQRDGSALDHGWERGAAITVS
jgi:hypothetical protein